MPESSVLLALTTGANSVKAELCQKCSAVIGCVAAMKTMFNDEVSHFYVFTTKTVQQTDFYCLNCGMSPSAIARCTKVYTFYNDLANVTMQRLEYVMLNVSNVVGCLRSCKRLSENKRARQKGRKKSREYRRRKKREQRKKKGKRRKSSLNQKEQKRLNSVLFEMHCCCFLKEEIE